MFLSDSKRVGDAQHDPRDIPRVIQPIMDGTADSIVGSRMQQESIPKLRRAGQKVLDQATSARILMELLSTPKADSEHTQEKPSLS